MKLVLVGSFFSHTISHLNETGMHRIGKERLTASFYDCHVLDFENVAGADTKDKAT